MKRGPYNLSQAERDRRAEQMRRFNADPVQAARFANMASRRMKAIHAAARKVMAK